MRRRGLPGWLILALVLIFGVAVDGIIYLWLSLYVKNGAVTWIIPALLMIAILATIYLISLRREDRLAASLLGMSNPDYREYIKKKKRLLREEKRQKQEYRKYNKKNNSR